MPAKRSLAKVLVSGSVADMEAALAKLPWYTLPAALAAVAVLCSLNTAGCGYVWDDRAAILGNKDLQPSTPLLNLFYDDFWGTPMSSPESHKSYRPVTVLSFRLNYLLSELAPAGFHLGNTLLHGGVVFAYVLLSRSLLPARRGEAATLLGGLLFAVHPVHVEAVAGIVGRADVLSCLFYILAVLAYRRAAKRQATDWLFLLLALLAASAAALSKEAGFTAFALLIFYDAVCVFKLLDPAQWQWRGAQHYQHLGARSAVVAGALVMLVLPRLNLHGEHMMYQWTIMENHVPFAPLRKVRALTYAWVHARYWGLLWWPSGLSFDHGYSGIDFVVSVWDARNLLSLLTYGMVAAWGLWAVRSQSVAQMTCVALLMGSWLPASHMLFPVGAVVAERLLYIPSVGFCIALGEMLTLVKVPPKLLKLAVGFVALLGAGKTWQQNYVWVDERALFLSALETYPDQCLKALNNIGMLMLNRDEAAVSAQYLETALEIYPDYASARFNYGLALGLMDEEVAGIENLQESLELDPKSAKAWGYLGQAQVEVGTMLNEQGISADDAAALFHLAAKHIDKSIAMGIELPAVWHARGLAALNLDQYESAAAFFDTALRMNEKTRALGRDSELMDEGNIYNNMLLCSKAVGNLRDALDYFERGVAVSPDMFELYNNAASVYMALGKPEAALQLYRQAEGMEPGDPVLINNIGHAEEEMGHLEAALGHYARALEGLPGHPTLQNNYARVATLLGVAV